MDCFWNYSLAKLKSLLLIYLEIQENTKRMKNVPIHASTQKTDASKPLPTFSYKTIAAGSYK